MSVPCSKSSAKRPIFPGILAPGSFHLNRPAIMRWKTRKSSSSASTTIRLPRRWRSTMARPSIADNGGGDERGTNEGGQRGAGTPRPEILGGGGRGEGKKAGGPGQ